MIEQSEYWFLMSLAVITCLGIYAGRWFHNHRDKLRRIRRKPAASSPKMEASSLALLYAGLDAGVVAFDRNLKLLNFNPAFAEMFHFDPVWLASRPVLAAILDRMAQKGQSPSSKALKDWKEETESLLQLEDQRTMTRDWNLPDGRGIRVKTLIVGGKFLSISFEDKTDTLELERKFKNEISILCSSLDAIDHAILIFGSGGDLIASNRIATKFWGDDFADQLSSMSYHACLKYWADQTRPSRIWGDLRDYPNYSDEQVQFSERIYDLDDNPIILRISPLISGCLMIEFWSEDAAANVPSEPIFTPLAQHQN